MNRRLVYYLLVALLAGCGSGSEKAEPDAASSSAPSVNAEWILAGGSADFDVGRGIVAGANGWSVAGSVSSAGTIGGLEFTVNGSEDLFRLHVNQDGLPGGLISVGVGTSFVGANDVARLGGGTVLAGYYWGETTTLQGHSIENNGAGDALLVALDESDGVSWIQSLGGTNIDVALSVASSTTQVVWAGSFDDSAQIDDVVLAGAGARDAFISSVSADTGASEWVISAGGVGDDVVEEVSVDSNGDVYIAGYFNSMIDWGCGLVNADDESDLFLAKLDGSSGECIWMNHIVGGGRSELYAMALSQTGTIAIAGRFDRELDFGGGNITSGGLSMFVASYNQDGGTLNWAKRVGATGFAIPWGAVADDVGNFIICGAYSQRLEFGSGYLPGDDDGDAFLTMYSADGKNLWSERIGGAGVSFCNDVAVNGDEIALTGGFEGSLQFADELHESIGDVDVFVAGFRKSVLP